MATPLSRPIIPAVIPCKRGHTEPRNRFNQCPACLRETRRKYNKRSARGQTPAPVKLEVVAPAPRQEPAHPRSFLAVAQEYLASQDNVAPATAEKRLYLLDQLRAIHDRPVAELTTPDFVKALKAIEALGDRRETAHRCGMFAGQVTRYAVNHGYATVNVLPSGQLRGALKPVQVESHAAITDAKRFGKLLDAIDVYCNIVGSRGHPSVEEALALAPLVFVRPGELRSMEWREVNLEKAEWLIPAEKMKMRRPHLVPLSTQALALLRRQHAQTGKGRYVFPAKWRRSQVEEKPLSENAFREAFRVMGPLMHETASLAKEHTMHGFRSSASTLLNGELGIDSALIELQLAHVKGDRIAGIYDRSQRIPERRELMQRWADYCDKLRAEATK